METTPPQRNRRVFGFIRRHLRPRIADTLLHRNVTISNLLGGLVTFAGFRMSWLPALSHVSVKDFVAGVLAFSALGFGAATSATVLALSIPRGRLYLTMIVNGPNAPRANIDSDGLVKSVDPIQRPLLGGDEYGIAFRSFYGDLIFVFLWTMVAQLIMGGAGLIYFVVAGDLNMVDCSRCRRSSFGLFIMVTTISYAILQMGSLIRAMADYARNQEVYDRRGLGL